MVKDYYKPSNLRRRIRSQNNIFTKNMEKLYKLFVQKVITLTCYVIVQFKRKRKTAIVLNNETCSKYLT